MICNYNYIVRINTQKAGHVGIEQGKNYIDE